MPILTIVSCIAGIIGALLILIGLVKKDWGTAGTGALILAIGILGYIYAQGIPVKLPH